MAATAKDLAEYLRLPPGSDASIERYVEAARSEYRAAGVPDFKRNAQYDLAVLALAAFRHDVRGLAAGAQDPEATERAAKRMKDAFVLQLRHAKEDPPPQAAETPEAPEGQGVPDG